MAADPDEAGGRGVGRFLSQLCNQHVSVFPLRRQQASHAVTPGRQSTVRSRHDTQIAGLVTDVRVSFGRTVVRSYTHTRLKI